MLSMDDHAKPTDLFHFQGIRKRIILAPDYSTNDERLKTLSTDESNSTEYDQLDFIDEQFEAYVRPSIDQSQWIANRQHERHEVDRLGDILDFYRHKPHLNDFEKRVMKRMTRQHRGVQTDDEPENLSKLNKNRKRTTINRLPPPSAMERIEKFLADNHWRLVDLFRTLDLKKSWNVVKEDFMRLITKEKLHMSEAEAEELLTCFCEEVHASMNYKKFARGRSLYKKSLRDGPDEAPAAASDIQTGSDTSTVPPSKHVQLPPTKTSHHYPVQNTTSSYVRSTISSFAKYRTTPIRPSETENK